MGIRGCFAFAVMVAVTGALPRLGVAQYDRQDLFLLPQGHLSAALDGEGWHLAGGPSYAVATGSPAAFAEIEQPAAGLAFRGGTHIDSAWIAGIGYDAYNTLWPRAAGAVVPVGSWRFGLGYGHWYRGARATELQVTTPLHPEGDGRTVRYEDGSRGETLMLAAAHRWAKPAWSASVGARAGVLRLVHHALYWRRAARGSLYGPGWALGGRVEARPAQNLGVRVDAFYQGRSVLLGDVRPDDEPECSVEGDGGPSDCIGMEGRTFSMRHRQPARVGLGAEVHLASRWQVRAEMLQVFWSSMQDNYADQGEWTVGVSLALTPGATLSLSYYRAGRDFMTWSTSYFEGPGTLTAHHLAVGGRLHAGPLRIDAAVADSRILSSDAGGQAVVQVGASVAW